MVTLTTPQATAALAGGYTLYVNEYNSNAANSLTSDGNPDFTIATSGISVSHSGAPGAYNCMYFGNHWGTLSAPATTTKLPIQVSAIAGGGVALTSVNITASGVAGGSAYDCAYDIWFVPTETGNQNGTDYELMIWLQDAGGIQPAGSVVASNVMISGVSWTVWSNGATTSYVATNPQTQLVNADIGLFAADGVARGYISDTWWLIDVEYGFELWTNGAGLKCNSFSVSIGGVTPPVGSNVTVDFTTNICTIDPLAVGFVASEFGTSQGSNPVPIVGSGGNAAWKTALAALAPGHVRCSLAWYGGNPSYGAGGSPGEQGSGGSTATALIDAIKSIGALPLVSFNGNTTDNNFVPADGGSIVHFFNDDGGQNGGPIHYWSIGNEPDNTGGTGPYMSGSGTGSATATLAAMRAADSTINIGIPAAAYWDTALLSWAGEQSNVGTLSYHAYDGGNTDGTGFPTDPQMYQHINKDLPNYKSGINYGVEECNWNPSYSGQTQFYDWHNTCFIADNCGQALSAGGHLTIYADANEALGLMNDGSGGQNQPGSFGTKFPSYWGLGIWTGMNGQFKRWGTHMVSASTTFAQGVLTAFASDSGKIVIVNKDGSNSHPLTISVKLAGAVTTGTYVINATQFSNPTGAIQQVASGSFSGSVISYTIPAGTAISVDVTAGSGGGGGGGQGGGTAFLRNDFEEGTNGTTITTANSAGINENPFDAVTIGSGNTVAFSNTEFEGTLSGKFATSSGGGVASVTWSTALGGTLPAVYGQVYLFLTANPTENDAIIRFHLNGASTCSIHIDTSGKIEIYDATSTSIHTFTNAVPLGQWVRIEYYIVFSATTGQVTVNMYCNPNSPG
jgi:cellulose 1,4-beta-cellobiosidase